ncbi:hypothetical protein T492DRAFT_1100084 [Pavlovales sp. CCMP2436]|nr:hypothetical protein T492DRAFT_1100084 [Pavlovales sp. CCMP2436]
MGERLEDAADAGRRGEESRDRAVAQAEAGARQAKLQAAELQRRVREVEAELRAMGRSSSEQGADAYDDAKDASPGLDAAEAPSTTPAGSKAGRARFARRSTEHFSNTGEAVALFESAIRAQSYEAAVRAVHQAADRSPAVDRLSDFEVRTPGTECTEMMYDASSPGAAASSAHSVGSATPTVLFSEERLALHGHAEERRAVAASGKGGAEAGGREGGTGCRTPSPVLSPALTATLPWPGPAEESVSAHLRSPPSLHSRTERTAATRAAEAEAARMAEEGSDSDGETVSSAAVLALSPRTRRALRGVCSTDPWVSGTSACTSAGECESADDATVALALRHDHKSYGLAHPQPSRPGRPPVSPRVPPRGLANTSVADLAQAAGAAAASRVPRNKRRPAAMSVPKHARAGGLDGGELGDLQSAAQLSESARTARALPESAAALASARCSATASVSASLPSSAEPAPGCARCSLAAACRPTERARAWSPQAYHSLGAIAADEAPAAAPARALPTVGAGWSRELGRGMSACFSEVLEAPTVEPSRTTSPEGQVRYLRHPEYTPGEACDEGRILLEELSAFPPGSKLPAHRPRPRMRAPSMPCISDGLEPAEFAALRKSASGVPKSASSSSALLRRNSQPVHVPASPNKQAERSAVAEGAIDKLVAMLSKPLG